MTLQHGTGKLLQKCCLVAKGRMYGLAGILIYLLCQGHGSIGTIKGHKGGLSIGLIAPGRFTQLLGGGSGIQYIVYNLEHQSQTIGILLQRFPLGLVCACGSGAHLNSCVDESAGLIAMNPQQLAFGRSSSWP